jgi:hypothetical protein
MLRTALHDGAEKIDCVGDPDDCDQDIDRPFEFCVLFARGDAERQRDGSE